MLIKMSRSKNEQDFIAFLSLAHRTIMFEVQTGRYPFYKMAAQLVMEAICEGRREDVRELRCSDTVKNLIQECWLHSALDRPEMSDINKELQHRVRYEPLFPEKSLINASHAYCISADGSPFVANIHR